MSTTGSSNRGAGTDRVARGAFAIFDSETSPQNEPHAVRGAGRHGALVACDLHAVFKGLNGRPVIPSSFHRQLGW